MSAWQLGVRIWSEFGHHCKDEAVQNTINYIHINTSTCTTLHIDHTIEPDQPLFTHYKIEKSEKLLLGLIAQYPLVIDSIMNHVKGNRMYSNLQIIMSHFVTADAISLIGDTQYFHN